MTEQSNSAAERSAHVHRGDAPSPADWPVVKMPDGMWKLKSVVALEDRIAELEAALQKVAKWERLLSLADSWITAAIECKEWRWDADQHEAATITRDEIRAALAGEKKDG